MAVFALQDLWCNVVGSSLDHVFVESSWDVFICEFTWVFGCSNKEWKLGFWNLGKENIFPHVVFVVNSDVQIYCKPFCFGFATHILGVPGWSCVFAWDVWGITDFGCGRFLWLWAVAGSNEEHNSKILLEVDMDCRTCVCVSRPVQRFT